MTDNGVLSSCETLATNSWRSRSRRRSSRGVVQHQDRAARRLTGQAGGVDGQAARREPVQLISSLRRLRVAQRVLNHVEQRPLAHHLPQTAADGVARGQFKQLDGAVVGEQDALVGVQRDDALDHAAEDGAQLLAVFLQPAMRSPSRSLMRLKVWPRTLDLVRHRRARRGRSLALADALDRLRQFVERPGDAARQRTTL